MIAESRHQIAPITAPAGIPILIDLRRWISTDTFPGDLAIQSLKICSLWSA